MKRFFMIIASVLAAFILQLLLLTVWPSVFRHISLPLLLTVCTAYIFGSRTGMFTGLLTGLLADISGSAYIGTYALLYISIGFLCGLLGRTYLQGALLIPVLLAGFSDFLSGLYMFFIRFIFYGEINFLFCLKHIILPEVFWTMLAALILYKPVHMLFRKTCLKGSEYTFV